MVRGLSEPLCGRYPDRHLVVPDDLDTYTPFARPASDHGVAGVCGVADERRHALAGERSGVIDRTDVISVRLAKVGS